MYTKAKHCQFINGYIYAHVVHSLTNVPSEILIPKEWILPYDFNYVKHVEDHMSRVKRAFEKSYPNKELMYDIIEGPVNMLIRYTISFKAKQYTVSQLENILGHKIEIVSEDKKN